MNESGPGCRHRQLPAAHALGLWPSGGGHRSLLQGKIAPAARHVDGRYLRQGTARGSRALRHARDLQFRPERMRLTDADFTDTILAHFIAICLDRKWGWIDNELVDRLWRLVKHEERYLRTYTSLADVCRSSATYFSKHLAALAAADRRAPRCEYQVRLSSRRPVPGSSRATKPAGLRRPCAAGHHIASCFSNAMKCSQLCNRTPYGPFAKGFTLLEGAR